MMSRTALEIVKDYYDTLQHAFQTGQLNPIKLHFADDIAVLGPEGKIEGKKNVLQMLEDELVPTLKRFEFLHQFSDRNTVCTIVDCIAKKNSHNVPCAEMIQVQDGKIKEIQLFYDRGQWEKIVQMKKAM